MSDLEDPGSDETLPSRERRDRDEATQRMDELAEQRTSFAPGEERRHGASAERGGSDGKLSPGEVFGDRYRVVTRLGAGGMGEVYRAEDLRLGETVALKLLPAETEEDPLSIRLLTEEVRAARKVTHPSVCRVYDIGEVGGRHFISMEYVDGENLGSLLQRIGRLPEERAVQLARQLCDGLAAAHDVGLLHRDLKPENIMLDGRGRVRIMDFGLAGRVGSVKQEEVGWGTPAYMAPEQLEGRDVTVRSDIYALGLVLYELFTGKPAFASRRSMPEMLAERRSSQPSSPSAHVASLDPAVEEMVLRCLQPDPGDRPASVREVAAGLPGGDPLAAALAAGETPSPELVAAVTARPLTPLWMLLASAGVAMIGLVAALLLPVRTTYFELPDTPPEVSVLRAREVLALAGVEEAPEDSAWGYRIDQGGLDPLGDLPREEAIGRLQEMRPSPVQFWYRERQGGGLMAWEIAWWDIPRVSWSDPDRHWAGMRNVALDIEGALVALELTPELGLAGSLEDANLDGVGGDERPAILDPVDWTPLLEAAGLDLDSLERMPPRLREALPVDTRMAFRAAYADSPDELVHVEVGAFQGEPVYFWVFYPDEVQEAESEAESEVFSLVTWGLVLLTLVFLFGLVVWGIALVRRSLRSGRADRTGAWRLALVAAGYSVLDWILLGHHADPRSFMGAVLPLLVIPRYVLPTAVMSAMIVWLLYVAVEPFARRMWPHAFITWNRLLRGRFHDPELGRDVLVGLTVGVVWAWIGFLTFPLTARLDVVRLDRPDLDSLLGLGPVLATTLEVPFTGLIVAMVLLLVVMMARRFTGSDLWTGVAFVGFLTLMNILASLSMGESLDLGWAMGTLGATAGQILTFVVLVRFGLVALTAVLVGGYLSEWTATYDPGVWYGEAALIPWAVALLLVSWSFWIARAGRPLTRRDLVEPQPG